MIYLQCKLLNPLKKKTKSLILIDGLGEESYLNNSKNDIQYDFLLAPYFGAENYFKKKKSFAWSDFFISDENLINVKKNKRCCLQYLYNVWGV